METRSTVMVSNAVVSSSHQLASFHGSNVLAKGGNVFDALITTSSVLSVVQNNLCGLGGDLFALLRGSDGKVKNLNGSGRSSHNASNDIYRERGMTSMPERGPYAAVTVPGMVHAWGEIHRNYCTMELKELLKPAIDIAGEGHPLTRKYVESIRSSVPDLSHQKGWTSLFLPNGRAPGEGEIFRQKLLANTLRRISEDGVETFYEGHLMEDIVSGLKASDSILDESDFSRHTSTWGEPLKTSYRGIDVYETYPNSQGATVSLWLNMLENHPDKLIGKAEKESLQVILNTGLKAYMARARYISDPEFHDLPHDFTSPKFAEMVENLPLEQWVSPPGTEDKGDTTYFCIADSEGNSASVIQSNYMGFGSGVSPDGTGFILQNRAAYFTLDEGHHNSLHPGKRSFHTLCAAMGIRDGDMAFIQGTMGGDIQPQVNVQLINRIVDRGMDVQDAVDYPRWAFFGTIYEKPSELSVEGSLSARIEGVDTAGLRVRKIPDMSSSTGHAQAIVYGKNGGLFAGADPRGDGAAVGF